MPLPYLEWRFFQLCQCICLNFIILQNIFLRCFTTSLKWTGLNCSPFLILTDFCDCLERENDFHMKTAFFTFFTEKTAFFIETAFFVFHKFIKSFWFLSWPNKHHRHKLWIRENWYSLVKESTFSNISFLAVCLASGEQKRNCCTSSSVARYRTNTMNCASFPKSVVSPNSEVKFPLCFAAVMIYFRTSTGSSWMRQLIVLFKEKP